MLLRLKNIGTLPLHGRMPGEEWTVQSDGEHRPVDALWRKRIADEDRYKVGILQVLGVINDNDPPAPPPADPAPPGDIGPVLDLFDVLDARMSALEKSLAARPDLTGEVKALKQMILDIGAAVATG